MSDGFDVAVEDDFSGRLVTAEAQMAAHLGTVAQSMASALFVTAQAKASGDLVNVRSGEYLQSLYTSVSQGSNGVEAELGSNSPKTVILEYGATIPEHDIFPRAGKMLRFGGSAGEVYASVIHDPGGKIVPREVLHSSLDEMSAEILARMTAVQQAFVKSLS